MRLRIISEVRHDEIVTDLLAAQENAAKWRGIADKLYAALMTLNTGKPCDRADCPDILCHEASNEYDRAVRGE